MDVTLNNNVNSAPKNSRKFKVTHGSGAITLAAAGDGAGSYFQSATVGDMIAAHNPDMLLYLGDADRG